VSLPELDGGVDAYWSLPTGYISIYLLVLKIFKKINSGIYINGTLQKHLKSKEPAKNGPVLYQFFHEKC
jgi:hypothetical protein